MEEEYQNVTAEETTEIPNRLTDADMLALERANSKKLLAIAYAEKAVAESEAAELSYKNLVMQLFLKYGLTGKDQIHQDGTFVRGGK